MAAWQLTREAEGSLRSFQPLPEGSPLLARPAPGPMALRMLALGTGTAKGWLGAQAGLGPAPSPLLSLPFPPWLCELSIAWVSSAPFNSFLGSSSSLHMFFFFLRLFTCKQHNPGQQNAGSTDGTLHKGWAGSRAASHPEHLRMGKVVCIGARDRLSCRRDGAGLCPHSPALAPCATR